MGTDDDPADEEPTDSGGSDDRADEGRVPAGSDDRAGEGGIREGEDDLAPPEPGSPTVTCSRCDDEWDLAYELDDLRAGNRAVEQFAMDHHRHTGHYPDEVTPWVARCRQCPQGEQFLAERPARRFAETHARHTRHLVELCPPEDEPVRIHPPAGNP